MPWLIATIERDLGMAQVATTVIRSRQTCWCVTNMGKARKGLETRLIHKHGQQALVTMGA